ncbi:hypothetical protein [Chryseobacterium sp. HR92]|uniref:hypothetical protein n=1 Tax=Chryseobacterium sp. HR92 TaxID=3094839 RepID=UPI003890A90B|nr:hypothetical protein SFA27_16890 [Chryseobacterium sp. HR92]
MNNTKFIKVSTADRQPEEEGRYLIYHKGFRSFLQSTFEPDDLEKVNYFKENIEYWLIEVPDYEEEMMEMLEKVLRINTHHNFNGNLINNQIKELLTKLKTES